MAEVTRFAPSPTGLLHLGHAYSAARAAVAAGPGGAYRVRIDDLDRDRSRAEFETALWEDLAWLGLSPTGHPPDEARRQSAATAEYRAALDRLRGDGLVYPCFCSRADIRREVAAMAGAPHGPDGPLYPGTCRALSAAERTARFDDGAPYAWRLDAAKAADAAGPLQFHDDRLGRVAVDPLLLGDAILARRDGGFAYHLAVAVDDAAEGITLVTRGEDLLPSTHLHRLLQAVLDLPVPRWCHHPLVGDEDGRRLAKRADAMAIRAYRSAGWSPRAVLDAATAALIPTVAPGTEPTDPPKRADHGSRPTR